MAESFRSAQEAFDTFEMTITETATQVRTGEGTLNYVITRKSIQDDHHLSLDVESEEMGALTWDVTRVDNTLFIESVDGLSEYVFERK